MNVRDTSRLLVALLPLACSAEPTDGEGSGSNCRGAKCDEADGTSACDVRNRSGVGGGIADVLNHNDPIANALFKKGDECPESFAEVVAKLNEFDNESCEMRTATVSETAQVMGKATDYRTVTTRDCAGRASHGMLFSLFGLTLGPDQLPDDLEVMAFDPEAGVFNYYDLVNGAWNFHGNSEQYVTGSNARCAGCHTGGGPIMKELDAPWLHWEGDTTTPGSSEFIDKHDDLGEITDGIEVEDLVRSGNNAWLTRRMTGMLERGDVEALLAPLFCAVEVNIGSATSSPNGSVNRIPTNVLMDNGLSFGSADMDSDVYQKAIEKSGQVIANGNGTPLQDENGDTVLDTHFTFSFPQRADADQAYVDRLVSLGVIDQEFASDVRAIDFTRPIFSDERCSLKGFAPDLGELVKPPAEPDPDAEEPKIDTGDCCEDRGEGDPGCSNKDIEACLCDLDEFCCEEGFDSACVEHLTTPDEFSGECAEFNLACGEGGGSPAGSANLVDDLSQKIREGFIANLTAESPALDTPEGQLLLALQTSDDDAHSDRARSFINACEARDQADFMDDVLMVVSRRRNEARELRVMEFAETLPVDDLSPKSGVRLNPLTCELTNEFVAHMSEAPPAPDSCLHVAEVFYDVAGTGDDGSEWIKIYNSCDDDQSLDGHSLAWGGKDYLVGGLDLSGNIDGKSCMIIGGPTSDDTNGAPSIDVEEKLSPNLQNSGTEADGVAIFNVVEDDVTTSSVPLDAVIYGGENSSELLDARGEVSGPHVGDAPAGATIIRTGRDSWEISDSPAPSSCPDF